MLHFTVSGRPDSPALLFLHGFLGSGADWGEVISRLEPVFRCIAVDLPGHGASCDLPSVEVYSIESATTMLDALLGGLGVDRCGVVGYSMGGRVALHFALHHPERCRKVVLESASAGIADLAEREARRALDEAHARRIEQDGVEAFVLDWYRQPLFASLSRRPDLMGRMAETRRRNEPAELARSLREMGTGVQVPLWDRLDRLRIPTLFVAGAEDGKYVDVARQMAVLSDFVQTEIVPDAGHTVHTEHPDFFADLLLDFFRAL